MNKYCRFQIIMMHKRLFKINCQLCESPIYIIGVFHAYKAVVQSLNKRRICKFPVFFR